MECVKDFFGMAFAVLCFCAGIIILFEGACVLEKLMNMGG